MVSDTSTTNDKKRKLKFSFPTVARKTHNYLLPSNFLPHRGIKQLSAIACVLLISKEELFSTTCSQV